MAKKSKHAKRRKKLGWSRRRALRETAFANAERLRALPNVAYVTIGRKQVAGAATEQLAIRVYVSKKKRHMKSGKAPARLRAVGPKGTRGASYFLTDVHEIDEPLYALALTGGDPIERWTRGSVGLIYDSKGGDTLLVTNAHVVARIDERPIGDAIEATDSTGQQVVVGHIRRMRVLTSSGENPYDAALVEPSVKSERYQIFGLDAPVIAFGNLSEEEAPDTEFIYVNRDRKVRCSKPELQVTPASIEFHKDHKSLSMNGFYRLKVDVGNPTPGDSGSVLVRRKPSETGYRVYGLVFAGNSKVVLVTPLGKILQALSSNGDPLVIGDSIDARIANPM